MSIESSTDRTEEALARIAPVAGVLSAGMTAAGTLTIGPFPDGSTPAGDLPGFYAAHGSHVALGGTLLVLGTVCFAIFAAAVWARVRSAGVPLVLGGIVLLGAAVQTVSDLQSGAVYRLLGQIGVDRHVTPEALQAWHIWGSEFGVGGGTTLFLLGVAAAGIAYRAIPRWLAWAGLLLAITPFTPFGFLGSLIFVLWVGLAGVALSIRPGLPDRRPDAVSASVG